MKGMRLLLLNTFLLLSLLLLVSCNSNTPNETATPSTQSSGTEISPSGSLYEKEMFAVEEDGILLKFGMTINQLEDQGLDVPDSFMLELENVLVFFDDSEKINDLTAYEGVKMSGKLNFSLTRDDILSLFDIDEDNEYIGDDPDIVTVFFNDKSSDQLERVVVAKESASQYNLDNFINLDIEFYNSEMLLFNLYDPE